MSGLKGSCDRQLPLPDTTVRRLEALKLKSTDSSGLLFNASDSESKSKNRDNALLFDIGYKRLFQIWCDIRQRAGIAKKFHAIRHGAAIRLYKQSRDIHLVKVCVGA